MVFNEVWLLTVLSLYFPFHWPPHTVTLFSFMSVLSSCPVVFTLFLFCAHFYPDLSLCAHTHTRTFFTKLGIGAPGIATRRFGSSVVPFHLVLPSSATTHFRLASSSFHVFSFVPLTCTCAFATPFPGRMETAHTPQALGGVNSLESKVTGGQGAISPVSHGG